MRPCALFLLAALCLAPRVEAGALHPPVRIAGPRGDVLIGDLIGFAPGALRLRTELAGEVTIPLARISDLAFLPAATVAPPVKSSVVSQLNPSAPGLDVLVTLHGGTMFPARLVGAGQGEWKLLRGDQELRVALAAVSTLRPAPDAAANEAPARALPAAVRPAPSPRRWQTGVDFGYNLTRGTRSTDDIVLNARSSFQRRRDKVTLTGLALYGTNNDVVANRRMAAGARYDYRLDDRLFAFGAAGIEQDVVRQIDLRQTHNLGMGYTVVATPRTNLALDGGIGYLRERLLSGATRHDGTALAEQTLSWKPSPRLQVTQRLAVTPYFTERGRVRGNLDVSIKTPIHPRLQFSIGLMHQYDSTPPPGVRPYNVTTLMGLGLIF